ncbi:MAG: WXG100 family type VII secretion target [Clostridiales bacterium]|nr:WXG100 family type VII secretion target [Clostridiales bacterium]
MATNADIQVSIEAKEASKKKFNTERENIVASLERLQREVNNVQSWWKGESGAAFMEKFTKVKAEIKAGIESCVADYCALMDATVDAHLEADRQLAAKVRSM